MPRHNSLAQLELFVLLSLFRRGGSAYSAEVRHEIKTRTGRRVSLAAVFVTLTRLEDRGFVSSEISDPRPVPGGRARKRFLLKPTGLEALQSAVTQLRAMLEEVPEPLGLDLR
jgi:DNA-binding PadR family transcriptional regulator